MRRISRPWFFVALVTAAIGISYFDRQALPVAIAAIQRNIPVSNAQFALLQSAFLATYALLYAGGGKLLDAIGTRKGFALSMAWWSLACALHGFAQGLTMLIAARLLLGMGEGAGFPAATRVIAEWLPATQRATAMGLINAGTAFGSVLAPPLIGLILLTGNWRYVFFFAGTIGMAWAISWWTLYRGPQEAGVESQSSVMSQVSIPWLRLLSSRKVLGMVTAKFLSDSAWYFCLFWLPKYLYDARGFDIKSVSYYAWIPYAASGIGSFLGGWFSSRLLRSGRSLNFSRKLALGLSAGLMPAVIFVPHVPVSFALLLFSIAFFGQQSWSGLIMTLPTDIFPVSSVGSVAGLIGFGGALGGAIFNLCAGQLLTYGAGYGTIFAIVGSLHAVAFIILLLTSGVLRAPETNTSQGQGNLVSL
ncbi:MFS transporter [Paracidobacterium acidisoli]|uniref:MFS transporter n=1 Tax=Paracidobacterium acidisoli TaxID=2303751 RepID=UPI002079275D|nr:MFS transporter [Paracidobacterium acidisoli]